MLDEEKLIPFHSTNLTGKRVLVLAPHPDDETIGCGGSLAIHANAGDPVKVVFLTSGARGDTSGKAEKKSYIKLRQEEASKACRCLGINDLEFLAYEDRALAGSRGVLTRMIDLLEKYKPELVYAPSPIEFHPDHRATAVLLYEAIRTRDMKFEIAFYEVGQPLSVNCLVDITSVLNQKILAGNAYSSQLRERPYKDIFLGLNRFRSLTLPEGVTHAEGFSLWETGIIRKMGPYAIPFQNLHRLEPDPGEAGPLVSVIVRTKNRPELLANALKSIAQQTYSNLEIIVVNDGGQDVRDVVNALAGNIPVTYITHEKSEGRSAAANSGLKAAHGAYFNFLDDDDVFYPDHVETLVSHLHAKEAKVAYSSVLNVYFNGPANMPENRIKEELIFNFDFDSDRLLFGNYIPFMSILFSRDVLSCVEGFCDDMVLYEDWDFLVRISRHFTFHHIDKVTAEYRFYGVTNIEKSHRQKYRYDEARAMIFDRVLPFLTGKAWVNFLNGGSLERLKRDTRNWEAKLSELEQAVRNYEVMAQEQEQQIHAKDAAIQEQEQQIQAKDAVIQEQEQQIQAKDTHIHNIESELNMIKQSKVWRIAEFFRRLIYQKVLGKFPLLQKGLLTITRGGFETFYIKARKKLMAFYRTKKRKLQKEHKLILSNEQIEPYERYVKNNQVQPHIRKILSNASTQFQYRPLISIIMPVHNVESRWLKAAVDSVIEQIYTNWKLCIADDASTNKGTLELLKSYENHDRIEVVFRTQNGHICAASNSAADLAEGEFVAFMDNDDLLAPNALFEIARILQDDHDVDLIYSDEDKIDENDKRYNPQFKPDWSPELFLSYNYVNHFTCIRRKLFESVGRFRTGYEGAQDYDLILRVIEKTNKIRHIPKVLYHWRAIKGSTALEAGDKPIMHTSALKGLKDHLKRKGIEAAIYQPGFAKSMCLPISQLDWPDNGPSVAIIIPTYNQYRLLRKCIESISDLTSYTNYEIVVVDNDSDDRDTLNYLEGIANKGIRVERIGNDGQPFSFSRINNLAVERVDTEYVLFLNNDIEVLEPRWLSRLAGYLGIAGVGVTGARLLYPNKTIQHAGVVMGMNDGIIPDHAFLNHHKGDVSYYFMAEVARNCSAVTGTCLMTRRSDFIRIGGFNEREFKVTLQDVDYCLHLAKKGLRTVYVAGAELIHYTSMSRQVGDGPPESARLRKTEDDPRELARLRETYVIDNDAYYNPNLSRIYSFALSTGCGMVDYYEYLKDPLKVVIFTHDLELKGAPKAMYDIAVGLQTGSGGRIVSKMVSPVSGRFQSLCDRAGIQCQVIDQNVQNICTGWMTRLDYDKTIKKVQEFLETEKPDVLITSTLFGFYVVHAAQQQDLPVIWIISESYTPTELEYYINDFAWPEFVGSFAHAYRVAFCSAATRDCYESFNSQNNFQVIHNSLDQAATDRFIKDVSKEEARQYLGFPTNKKVLLMVGTVCERKGQDTIVKAAAILNGKRDDFCFYLVGASINTDDVYLQNIYKEVDDNNLSDIIKIIPETEEVYWYYRASDIYVFTSHMECHPLSIIEAMAFGLPIITTPCYGVKEQVRDVNGLFFDESDAGGLAVLLNRLLDDKAEREYLGKNSRGIFEYEQTYKEMIDKYKHLVFGAWIRGKHG